MRKETGEYEPLFQLESWRVIVEQRAEGKVETEATIRIWIDGERYVRTAEGNGPVNALDSALRSAICEIHPHLTEIELVNYKVRILDESHGTGAITRVLIDASDGADVWGTIGVGENVIAASWQALVDSLEFPEQGLRRDRAAAARSESAGRDRLSVTAEEEIPLARPVLGDAEEAAVIEVLRSGQLSLGPRVPAVRSRLRTADRRPARQRRLERDDRPAPVPARRRRRATATRSSRARSRSSPAPTSASTSARARSSRTSTRSR